MIHLLLLGYKGLKSLQGLKPELLSMVEHVTIGIDKNILNDYSEELISFCNENNINYSIRSGNDTANSEYLLAIGWRWIINIESNQKLIVFHDSKLPKYRGFNPLVSTLINGDKTIGVTAFLGTQEFDKGRILAQWEHSVRYPIKIQSAIELVSTGYVVLLNQVFTSLYRGKEFIGVSQEEDEATYSVWRDEEDYYINWSQSAERIIRTINATGYPYRGARTRIGDKIIRIDDAETYRNLKIENPTPGKILFYDQGLPVIICGEGLIKLITISEISGEKKGMLKRIKIRLK